MSAANVTEAAAVRPLAPRTIPAAGAILKPEDNGIVQTTLE
jgi:hypothetical protein